MTDTAVLPLVPNLEAISTSGFYRLPVGSVCATFPAPDSDQPRRYDFVDDAGRLVSQRVESKYGIYARFFEQDTWTEWKPVAH